jgi:ankyrin repeat protein
LRDTKGKTFLHVAVEKKKRSIVEHACRTASLQWILNMRDDDGNTALHLAVQTGDTKVFFPLLRNRQVRMNLTNNNGQTPRDMSLSDIPPGLSYKWVRATARSRISSHYY